MKQLFKKIIKIFSGGWKCPNCGSRNTQSSTYADWCIKNGYQYADKIIPEFWFSE